MFTRFSPQAQSIPDLAAGLTDKALELLRGFNVRGDSVEMELSLWRALTAELKREQNLAPRDDDAALDGALKHVVNRAALRVVADRPRFTESGTYLAERPAGHLSRV